jgi:hypothetical protein
MIVVLLMQMMPLHNHRIKLKQVSFAAAQKASYEEVSFHAMHGVAIKNDYLDLHKKIDGFNSQNL